jgi:hypothetical protein
MMRLPPKIAARQAKARPLPAGAARPRERDDAGAVVITLPRPPTPPLTMNRVIGMHWAAYRPETDPWRDEFATMAKGRRRAVRALGLPVTIELTLRFARGGRRDPANYYPNLKSVIDGLVIAACLDDDSPAYVHTLEPVVVVDRTSQEVTLRIWPALLDH